MIMEYVLPISIFLMVLSPLFIPIGVSIVHAIRTWRPQLPVLARAASSERRLLEPAVELS
jgi:hypothetical protein